MFYSQEVHYTFQENDAFCSGKVVLFFYHEMYNANYCHVVVFAFGTQIILQYCK